MKKLFTIILLIAMTGFFATNAFAKRGHHDQRGERMMSPEMVDRLSSKLDLNEEQKSKVMDLSDKVNAILKENRAERTERVNPIEGFAADTFDRDAFTQAMSYRMAENMSVRSQMLDLLGEFHAILTVEQREEFLDMTEGKWGRMSRRY